MVEYIPQESSQCNYMQYIIYDMLQCTLLGTVHCNISQVGGIAYNFLILEVHSEFKVRSKIT